MLDLVAATQAADDSPSATISASCERRDVARRDHVVGAQDDRPEANECGAMKLRTRASAFHSTIGPSHDRL